MSNIHGLFSNKKDNDDDDDDQDDSNNRYVGGIGDRGGGSGLAVQPNNTNDNDDDDTNHQDAIFGLAEQAGGGADAAAQQPPRRTITMYKNGFIVDNGPYRRLNDPSNAEFLRSLAQGRTPRELLLDSGDNITVGLIDKRSQEYNENENTKFKSFSGTGNSLGSSSATTTTTTTTTEGGTTTNNGIFDPSTFNATTTTAVDESQPTTSIQVRMMNGKRQVLKLNLTQSVQDLGQMIGGSDTTTPFTLSSGFPPRVITNVTQSIEDAGLKGSQVIQKKA